MPQIDLTYGHETFSEPNLGVRITPSFRKKPYDKSVPLYTAMKDGVSGIRSIRYNQLPASNINSFHGAWNRNVLELPEGSLITFNCLYTGFGNGFNKIKKTVFMINIRENAALRRLSFRLTNHSLANFPNITVEGRFDVLSLDDLKALGIEQSGELNFYDDEVYSNFITDQIIEQAKTALVVKKAVIKQTLSGKKVIIKNSSRRLIGV
jgi:hypothetical protein